MMGARVIRGGEKVMWNNHPAQMMLKDDIKT